MTKGQLAMAVAKIYPKPEQGKRKTSSVTKEVGTSRLSYARTVLRHAPDLGIKSQGWTPPAGDRDTAPP